MSPSDVPSYQALIDQASELLSESSDTPRIDAEILLQHASGQNMAWLIARGDQLASSDHIRDFFAMVEDRQQGQPVAYIIGYREFWTLKLSVDSRVLIPRPDTETLVEQALSKLAKSSAPNLLDLGTGSGAIALSLAKERPYAHVLAVDVEPDALSVAQHNAESNKLSNVEFQLSSWFDALEANAQFDLIASNPPYIETGDPHLTNGDLRFEPDSALSAADKGLADLKTIIATAPAFLSPNGWLVVEHGFNQADEVEQLFRAHGFDNIEMHRDLNHLPRCTIGSHRGPAQT